MKVKRAVSSEYMSKVSKLCNAAIAEFEKAPDSVKELAIKEVTVKRWANCESVPNPSNLKHLLDFLRLTQSKWEQYLDNQITFDELWQSRGKSVFVRSDEPLTKEKILNDIRCLPDDIDWFIERLFQLKKGIVESVAPELITLSSHQLKRLHTLLKFSCGQLGFTDLDHFKDVIESGASQAVVTALVDQKKIGFQKDEYETLLRFCLKPIKWVNDDFVNLSNQKFLSVDDLINEL